MGGIGGMYAEGRARLSELVLALGADEARAPVPACPQWTVRDVVAHLAGVCADVLAGNTEGLTTEPWADAQVSQRRDHTIGALVGEWSALAPRLEAVADGFPPPMGTLWVLDLATHEQDVRGALGLPGARRAPGIAAALEFLVGHGLHLTLSSRSVGPLEVRTPDARWVVGGGASAGAGTDPVGAVDVDAFELFRALTGRRSRSQIARWAWTVDPEPFLDSFAFGTFTTRATDLVE